MSSNNQIIIEPSILSANFAYLGKGVEEAQSAGAKGIQIDIMDGQFVPNISFGWDTVAAIRPLTDMFLDVHLMIVQPERYLENFAKAGADRIIVHQETCTHLHRVLSAIKESGVEAGVTINPGTSIDTILPILDLVDLVQIMTVNPGFGGQSFIHSQLERIASLKQIIQERDLDVAMPSARIAIAVDGGINPDTAPLVVEAGATVLVAGSSVYNSKASVEDNLATLYAAIEKKGT